MRTCLQQNTRPVGVVFWITGLPKSGKTTLAQAFSEDIRAKGYATVMLDGDAFRRACGNDLGFDPKSRLLNARRLNGMCRLLSEQGLTVVCSTVSLITEIHALNRTTIQRYVEVFLNVPVETLRGRDPAFYNAADCGLAMIPGINQTFELPESPEIVFEPAGGTLCLEYAISELLKWMH